MAYEISLISILEVILTLIIALFIGVLIPGIERKYVQARIQQRIGPPVTSPGLWASIKFLFKENIEPNSPAPGLYKAMPILMFHCSARSILGIDARELSVHGFR